MQAYLVPFLAYALSAPILNYFVDDLYISYTVRTFLTGLLIFIYRKEYKLKFRLDFLSFFTGILIFGVWFLPEGSSQLLGNIEFVPSNSLLLLIKLAGFLMIAPLIEELFVRSFLMRLIIDRDWKKVPIGKFTWPSFLITALLFGFSHNLWARGIIVGIMLNLLLYKKKRIESCIFAHFIANLFLAIYVFATSSWYLW